MAGPEMWCDFIKALRREQDKLRAELQPYLAGSIQVLDGTSHLGRDDKTITAIKQEIASLQKTIDRVISKQGLQDA
ncbi:MAG TPA: hypothetical protein VGR91_13440 [Stellaceae bacterium]|nr:hypothetical protein [Stellaceae bacterium]